MTSLLGPSVATGIHPNYLRLVCNFIREEGGDLDAILADSGTPWTVIENAEFRLPFTLARHIILNVQQVSPRPTLALEIGARIHLGTFGPLGLAAAASKTLRQALAVFERFAPLRSDTVHPRLHTETAGTWLVASPQINAGALQAFALDSVAATWCGLVATLTGRQPHDAFLEIPWAEPPWRHAYARLAGSLQFNAGRMALWLPNALLDLPCPTASPSDFDMALRLCEAEEAWKRSRCTFAARITELLRSGDPSLFFFKDMARHVGMSRRTLLRRLQEEGSSFQALVDEERRLSAVWQLRHTDHTLSAIAASLGYNDATNFSRTFRRWFNQTPRDFKQGLSPPAPKLIVKPRHAG